MIAELLVWLRLIVGLGICFAVPFVAECGTECGRYVVERIEARRRVAAFIEWCTSPVRDLR